MVLGYEQLPGTTRTLLTQEQGGLVKRTVLPSGIRIITEKMPTVRSAAIGIWVNVGSRDEIAAQTGSAHYLEHLLCSPPTMEFDTFWHAACDWHARHSPG